MEFNHYRVEIVFKDELFMWVIGIHSCLKAPPRAKRQSIHQRAVVGHVWIHTGHAVIAGLGAVSFQVQVRPHNVWVFQQDQFTSWNVL